MVAWETVVGEFTWDGSLRDLYVLDTTIADWQRLFAWLHHCPYEVVYLLHGQPAPLPTNAGEALAAGDAARMVAIRFEGVQANCHFFGEGEIELDIDPRKVTGQTGLDALFEFMRQVANVVGKDVILTPENMREIAIFRVRPGSPHVHWQEFGGWR